LLDWPQSQSEESLKLWWSWVVNEAREARTSFADALRAGVAERRKLDEWTVRSLIDEVLEQLQEAGVQEQKPGRGAARQLPTLSGCSTTPSEASPDDPALTGAEAAAAASRAADSPSQAPRGSEHEDGAGRGAGEIRLVVDVGGATVSGCSTAPSDADRDDWANPEAGGAEARGAGGGEGPTRGGLGGEHEDRARQEVAEIMGSCAVSVAETVVWEQYAIALRKRLYEQTNEERFGFGSNYHRCTTAADGSPLELHPSSPGDSDSLLHAIPLVEPPRSKCYVQVKEEIVGGVPKLVADPTTLTLTPPQDKSVFPGWNLAIPVTDSQWSWQLFTSVWNSMQFAVNSALALQQAVTLPSVGLGFWKCLLYVVVVFVKIVGPFFLARKDHKPDPDMPAGFHRTGHRLRDLFCHAIGIHWLVLHAHRLLTPESLKAVDRQAKNVGSRQGCRVPEVYLGPCENQLWLENKHMIYRLAPTIGADGVLLVLALLLVEKSFGETQTLPSRVIAVGNCAGIALSLAGLVLQLRRLWRGVEAASRYAEAQLARPELLKQGTEERVRRDLDEVETGARQLRRSMRWVAVGWGVLLVVLCVFG